MNNKSESKMHLELPSAENAYTNQKSTELPQTPSLQKIDGMFTQNTLDGKNIDENTTRNNNSTPPIAPSNGTGSAYERTSSNGAGANLVILKTSNKRVSSINKVSKAIIPIINDQEANPTTKAVHNWRSMLKSLRS